MALVATLSPVLQSHAQNEEKPNVCFLRYVNAIAPGKGNANVIINGEDIFPKGYALGQFTGGFGLEAGSHTIKIEK
ncbi:MAG: DUF4397 domain-containing protein, partial [Verrucomicrobiae bacterium]|nr:DUF4397 domain-containing protein [Verrucomicrobiae bacterium]